MDLCNNVKDGFTYVLTLNATDRLGLSSVVQATVVADLNAPLATYPGGGDENLAGRRGIPNRERCRHVPPGVDTIEFMVTHLTSGMLLMLRGPKSILSKLPVELMEGYARISVFVADYVGNMATCPKPRADVHADGRRHFVHAHARIRLLRPVEHRHLNLRVLEGAQEV